MKCRTLASSPYSLLVCASPAYLQAHGTPAQPSDLADHACLGYVFTDRVMDKEWTFTRHGKAYPVQVGSRLRVNSADAQLKAANWYGCCPPLKGPPSP